MPNSVTDPAPQNIQMLGESLAKGKTQRRAIADGPKAQQQL